MVQRRRGVGFLLEPRATSRVATSAGRTLIATSRRSRVITRAIDFTHSPRADAAEDFVRAEASACRNGHAV